MGQKSITVEEHFLIALTPRRPGRSLVGILDCLDEDSYRAVHTIAEALRGGNDPESVNCLILAAGRLLREAAHRMPEWAEEATGATEAAAETADQAGCLLVKALALQAWLQTSRILCDDEPFP